MADRGKLWLARGAVGPAAAHGNTPASLLDASRVRRSLCVQPVVHVFDVKRSLVLPAGCDQLCDKCGC